ncbi:hypothetical protein RJ639_018173 [Escallonia herrerae]|uniref:LysM domain-containing protein n=1 Tax=Escallonia herrerae TaxID=1293975 RepID=A0AA88V8N8_9ASTE|nr:hypothetical protein RJ639_018173 [Escallonia herrerae]
MDDVLQYMRGPEDDLLVYGPRSSLFTLKVHHGGEFKTQQITSYVGGSITFFDYVPSDRISLLWFDDMCQALGYEGFLGYYFKEPLGEAYIHIAVDDCILYMVESLPRSRVVDIYTTHPNAVKHINKGVNNDLGSDTVEVLSVHYASQQNSDNTSEDEDEDEEATDEEQSEEDNVDSGQGGVRDVGGDDVSEDNEIVSDPDYEDDSTSDEDDVMFDKNIDDDSEWAGVDKDVGKGWKGKVLQLNMQIQKRSSIILVYLMTRLRKKREKALKRFESLSQYVPRVESKIEKAKINERARQENAGTRQGNLGARQGRVKLPRMSSSQPLPMRSDNHSGPIYGMFRAAPQPPPAMVNIGNIQVRHASYMINGRNVVTDSSLRAGINARQSASSGRCSTEILPNFIPFPLPVNWEMGSGSSAPVSNSRCNRGCDLALASYYVQPAVNMTFIAAVFEVDANDIPRYNPQVPNLDSIQADARINIPFSCNCLGGQFLGHAFLYNVLPGDRYDTIATRFFANLTTEEMLQRFNRYDPTSIPIVNARLNVTVNCSCGDARVSKDYGVFATYPLRQGDSLDSIAAQVDVSADLLRRYNPNANFSAGTGLVYLPIKGIEGSIGSQGGSNSEKRRKVAVIVGLALMMSGLILSLSITLYVSMKKKMRKQQQEKLKGEGSVTVKDIKYGKYHLYLLTQRNLPTYMTMPFTSMKIDLLPGYMSPEYAGDGLFSVKSDVFSFGVLVLEIAWMLYKEGRSLELLDTNLGSSCNESEVLQSINVGLLCVQQCPGDRPSMSSVVLMLGHDGALPQSKEPGFFINENGLHFDDGHLPSNHGPISANEMTITLLDAR